MSLTDTPAGTPAGARAASAAPASAAPASAAGGIDPRGPQLAAALTTVVLAVVLLLAPSPLGAGLLAAQALVFALGAAFGAGASPYGLVFGTLVRPRLAPPTELADAGPPRFAQTVGLGFAVVGLVGFLAGVTLLGQVAVGLALVAAFLNAAFRFCLGSEVLLLARRIAA